MATHDTNSAAKMMDDYTYRGVWKMHDAPALQKWKWTVTPLGAVLVLGVFGFLLAFSQTRAWIIIRHFVYLRKKTVRLDNDSRPNPLEELSQAKAVADILPSIVQQFARWPDLGRFASQSQRRSPDTVEDSDSPVISPWFGFLALLNLAVFGTMGIVLPCILSDYAPGGAPIVRTRNTDACQNGDAYGFRQYNDLFVEQAVKTDKIFRACSEVSKGKCNVFYLLNEPWISMKRGACPFSENICQNDTSSVEITHSNITALGLGINSRSALLINHRLTCAPVDLDPFLNFEIEPGRIFISLAASQTSLRAQTDFLMALETVNGPNSFSNESSGRRMALDRGAYDLKVLPTYGIQTACISEINDYHPYIRRTDGDPFLIIHRPGRSRSWTKIDDPFFAAREEHEYSPLALETLAAAGGSPRRWYYPDREATALGFLEQFKFCGPPIGDGGCTVWGPYSGKTESNTRETCNSNPSELSVAGYLRAQTSHGPYGRVPFTEAIPWLATENQIITNTEELWITEVETWFRNSVLNGILFAQNRARIQLGNWSDYYRTDYGNERRLCNHILYRNPNYTNINWIGLWIANTVLILICLTSFIVKKFGQYTIGAWKFFLETTKCLWRKLIPIGRTLRREVEILVFIKELSKTWKRLPHSPVPRTSVIVRASKPAGTVSELNHIQRTPEFDHRGIWENSIKRNSGFESTC